MSKTTTALLFSMIVNSVFFVIIITSVVEGFDCPANLIGACCASGGPGQASDWCSEANQTTATAKMEWACSNNHTIAQCCEEIVTYKGKLCEDPAGENESEKFRTVIERW